MHYCLLLITKEFPTQEVIDKALAPYNEEEFYKLREEKEDIKYPCFLWDFWKIGGRYDGALKLKIDMDDKKYNWQYYSCDGRNGKLFLSRLLSDMKNWAGNTFLYTEENYYNTMGMRDDFLRVDGAFIDDLLNFDEVQCCLLIDKDGKPYAREYYDGEWKDNDNFDNELAAVKSDSKGCYATIIDIHD